MDLVATAFREPGRRLDQADRFLKAFAEGAKAYLESSPFEKVDAIEKGPAGPERVIKVILTTPIPIQIQDDAVAALEAIWSALELACHASARVFGKEESKYSSFPIADDEDNLDRVIKGRCKDLEPEILDLIKSWKPFRWGAGLLWAFNQARQRSQHRIIAAMAIGNQATQVGEISLSDVLEFRLAPQWDFEKGEMVIARLRPGGSAQIKALYIGTLVFHGAGVLDGEPAGPRLSSYLRMVRSMVGSLETKTREVLAAKTG